MTSWPALEQELDHWQVAGHRASLWWRDDDAVKPGPQLDRLLHLADGLPLHLAVIPSLATGELARLLREKHPQVLVLLHGWAHQNNAPQGEKKAEFGAHRTTAEMLSEIADGWTRLRGLFARQAMPVFVPPWNRVAPELADQLSEAGIELLSVYNPRDPQTQARSRVNTHVDIIDWRGSRGYAGDETVLGLLTGHLRARRLGEVDSDEPTGILSHHIVHDDASWRFLRQLREFVAKHPAAHWVRVEGRIDT